MEEKKIRSTYFVHNTTRSIHKKEIRRHLVGPLRSQLNLKIGGGAMLVRRGRPISVSEVLLCQHLPELIDLEKKGLVEVYDHKTVRVNLTELEPVASTPDPKKRVKPQPAPVAEAVSEDSGEKSTEKQDSEKGGESPQDSPATPEEEKTVQADVPTAPAAPSTISEDTLPLAGPEAPVVEETEPAEEESQEESSSEEESSGHSRRKGRRRR